MKVPLLDPRLNNESCIEELEAAASSVLRSGQYILGQRVEDFESQISTYLNVDHAIGVSSGTDALLLSLMALDIGPGDEVICPSFTFFATAGSIVRVGATPVFVDIQPDCFTCDPSSIESAITSKTKAIIPVHLFGQSADMTRISAIAKKYSLFVIEDAAQAIGCELNGIKVGRIGDIGCFSFFPSKNLGGFGDAGLVTTNDSNLASKLRTLRVHGGKDRYFHDAVGGNFRIDALQAALLSVKLPYLNNQELRRWENSCMYETLLKNSGFILPKEVRGKHVYNQYTIKVPKKRDELQKYLAKKGIASGIYYPLPLHKQKCFQHLVPGDIDLPVTDGIAKTCLSLPIASELTVEQLIYVSNTLQESEGKF